MRLALVTPDGLRIRVEWLVGEHQAFKRIRQVGTHFFQTGDCLLGMAIMSALPGEES